MGDVINKTQWIIFLVLVVISAFLMTSRQFLLFFAGILLLIIALSGIRVIFQYERGILFTLGKYSGMLEPGLVYVIPMVQSLNKVDVRVSVIDIPSQEVITKDNVSIKVNGTVFFKVFDPKKAILEVEDYRRAIGIYSQTVLRDVIGGVELDELLQNRDKIAEEVRKVVDKITDEWGIDVVGVKIQDIELPEGLKRAMARQAEAEREKRAIIIKSEGEVKAAENLEKAAEIIGRNENALYLRVLHTLSDISGDPNQKIIILLPFNALKNFFK